MDLYSITRVAIIKRTDWGNHMAVKKATTLKKTKAFERGVGEFNHHLFKLTASPMIKEHGWNSDPDQKIVVPLEHCHMFHTMDSRGRSQTKCSSIGGHYHEVEVEYSEDPTNAPEIKVGPAMREIAIKQGKRIMKKSVPVTVGGKVDQHTHDVEYHGFDKIKARKMNEEFAKYQSEVQRKVPSHPEIK